MVLRKLASYLLPTDTRENILGDLEERGFRAADLGSVIVAAWVSYFHREWFGPVPSLANASTETIDARTQQLLRSRQAWVLFYVGAYATAIIVTQLQVPLNPLVVFLPIQILLRTATPLEPRFLQTLFTQPPVSIDRYRAAIKASVVTVFMPAIAFLTLTRAFPPAQRYYLMLAVVALTPVLIYRIHRRFQELRALPETAKP